MADQAETDDWEIEVEPPLFLLLAQETCYRCKANAAVIAFATLSLISNGLRISDDDEPSLVILQYVERMPPEIETFVTARFPSYRKHFSRTADLAYFANFCVCGANFGDHFLGEPDAAFFPTTESDARKIQIHSLSFRQPMQFRAGFSDGTVGTLIYKHAVTSHLES